MSSEEKFSAENIETFVLNEDDFIVDEETKRGSYESNQNNCGAKNKNDGANNKNDAHKIIEAETFMKRYDLKSKSVRLHLIEGGDIKEPVKHVEPDNFENIVNLTAQQDADVSSEERLKEIETILLGDEISSQCTMFESAVLGLYEFTDTLVNRSEAKEYKKRLIKKHMPDFLKSVEDYVIKEKRIEERAITETLKINNRCIDDQAKLGPAIRYREMEADKFEHLKIGCKQSQENLTAEWNQRIGESYKTLRELSLEIAEVEKDLQKISSNEHSNSIEMDALSENIYWVRGEKAKSESRLYVHRNANKKFSSVLMRVKALRRDYDAYSEALTDKSFNRMDLDSLIGKIDDATNKFFSIAQSGVDKVKSEDNIEYDLSQVAKLNETVEQRIDEDVGVSRKRARTALKSMYW